MTSWQIFVGEAALIEVYSISKETFVAAFRLDLVYLLKLN